MTTDYSNEPSRDTDFSVNSAKPFNAEPPADELLRTFFTPSAKFFVRNHAPVPLIDKDSYSFFVNGVVKEPKSFTLLDVVSLPSHVVSATVQCAGNRRQELKDVAPVKGVTWSARTLSNALWEGVSLNVLFKKYIEVLPGVLEKDLHVEVEGYDFPKETVNEESKGYTISIPFSKAQNDSNVILAYKMNGKDLTPDHGFPLRLIVPGFIGARMVKWVKRISILPQESKGFFQARDYKVFNNSTTWDNVQAMWDEVPAITNLNVQAAILNPKPDEKLREGDAYLVRGYALTGCGNSIQRVDVSLDGGSTWQYARLLPRPMVHGARFNTGEDFSWVLWEFPIAKVRLPLSVSCRAVDTACNSQPQSTAALWNLRGVMNNAIHHVFVAEMSKY